MASAGTVEVNFAAQTAKFTAELKRVQGSLGRLQNDFKAAQQTVDRFLNIAVISAAVGIVSRFTIQSAQAADAFGKVADKIGIGTERLATFHLAAEDAGVSLETIDKVLLDSQRRLGEAAAGKGEAASFIKRLGLDVRELQALSPDQLFTTYSDAINGLKNRSDQLAAAQALFGKSGQEAFALIEAGRPAIDQAQQAVDRYGLALSRVDIKQIEAANDKIGLLGKISDIAGQRIAAGLSPFISAMAESMLDATGNTEDLQRRIEQFGAGAYTAFQVIANGARTVEAAFFGLAAAGARLLQAVTFGNVSDAFAASVEANLKKAQDALDKIKSIEQIQQGIVAVLEKSRTEAAEAVAKDEARRNARSASGSSLTEPAPNPFTASPPIDFSAFEEHRKFQEKLQKDGADYLDRYLKDYIDAEQQRMRASAEAEAAIAQFKQDGFNAAQSLLTAYHGKFKGIATAILAYEKAQAIASTIINTREAMMKTLAKHGGTPLGYAQAAGIAVLGAAQVAAIASTVIGGGSNSPSLGAPNNPVFTESSGNGSGGEERQFGSSSQRAIQIEIHGFIGKEQVDQMIDALRDEIDSTDRIIISQNSRQAQELRDG